MRDFFDNIAWVDDGGERFVGIDVGIERPMCIPASEQLPRQTARRRVSGKTFTSPADLNEHGFANRRSPDTGAWIATLGMAMGVVKDDDSKITWDSVGMQRGKARKE